MVETTVTVNFTVRTLDALAAAGLALLKDRIGQFAFNEAVATGTAPGMIEVVAWFHEQNAHYYDRRFRNSLLFIADTLESMRILTRAQSYRMRPATAASVAVLVEPEPPQPAAITLPVGTKVAVGDLVFELLVPAIIPPSVPAWPDGTTDDVIAFTEGFTREDRFTSNGAKFQPFKLTQPGIIDGSVTVAVLGELWDEVLALAFVEGSQSGRDAFTGTGISDQEYVLSLFNALTDIGDDDGLTVLVFPQGQDQSAVQVWQQVEDFTGAPREYVTFKDINGVVRVRFGVAANGAAPGIGDSIQVLYLITGAQKRYQLTYDEFDAGEVKFGDGIFGVIPPIGADIIVRYRVGGGVRGNIAPGKLDTTVQGTLPSGGRTPVRLRNLERGDGGNPPESVEHARFFAPRFAKSNDRAVRKEDWVMHANTYIDSVFGAPAHANAFLKQKRPELNTVRVAVWGRDDLGRVATPGTPLKIGLKRFLDTKRTFTTAVEMIDGEVLIMDVEVSLLLVQGATRSVVFSAVTSAIQSFFNSSFVRPGVDLPIGGLFQAIEEVEGVDRAQIDRIRGSRLAQISVGTGDGNTKLFMGDFVLERGTEILPESVTINGGAQQMVDDGDGAFTGDIDPSVLPGPGNIVTYADGKFQATFNQAPPLNAAITAEAKLEVFFGFSEDIGASDGSVSFVDVAATYYPIVRRGPIGGWSGDPSAVVDGNQVGASAQFRGTLPTGIIGNSPVIPRPLRFIDSTGVPQVVVDNGVGVLLQGFVPVGTVGYSTGVFNFTFLAPPVLPVRVEWSTRTVDIFIPAEFLPLEPGRLFFWGGISQDGAQPGAELVAFDDGDGNIVGDVLAGGFIIYETGHVVFAWNTDPPPGIAGGVSRFGRLVQVPDGVLTAFDLQVRTATGGGGVLVDLSSGGVDGEGRTRFRLSGLSTIGFTLADAFDNWQGSIEGVSLDHENNNSIIYSLGTGKLTFKQPLPVGTSQDFPVQVTNVATFMYSAFVYRVKTPASPGLDKGLFADNNGRLWGDSANPFPVNRLDHLRARLTATLAGSPIAIGRSQMLTYDALTGVPPVRDVPVAGDQIAVAGRISLVETPPEVEGEA